MELRQIGAMLRAIASRPVAATQELVRADIDEAVYRFDDDHGPGRGRSEAGGGAWGERAEQVAEREGQRDPATLTNRALSSAGTGTGRLCCRSAGNS